MATRPRVSDDTRVMAAVDLPPSQTAQIPAPATAPARYCAEDSYDGLAAYDRLPVRRAEGRWLRPHRDDETPYDQTLRSFHDRYGVIGDRAPRKRLSRLDVTVLDTSIFATVAAGEFLPATTTGKQVAR